MNGEKARLMNNFTKENTVYTKTIKTVRLKLKGKYRKKSKECALASKEAYEVLKKIYHDLDDDQEHLTMLVLNARGYVTGFKVVASGGQVYAAVDCRIIFRNALALGAAKIILAHNHPSAIEFPSNRDIASTRKVIRAGSTVDVPLEDHLILTRDGYISIRDLQICEF